MYPVKWKKVDELAAQAQTPEDKALVESWRAEVATEREEALKSIGHNALVVCQTAVLLHPKKSSTSKRQDTIWVAPTTTVAAPKKSFLAIDRPPIRRSI